MKKYYYLYKITNLINNKYYYGVHSTDDINDGYMGSGSLIKKAIKKYGKVNFKKEILEYFNDKEQMYQREAEIINETVINDKACYNFKLGGEGGTSGYIPVKDKNGNTFAVKMNDPRFLNGEVTGITKGKFKAKDKNGNIIMISKEDPRYLSGELIGINKGKVPVKDENGNTQLISKEEFTTTSKFHHPMENKVVVKDKGGNIFSVDKNDPRYLSGELVGATKSKISVKDKEGNNFLVDIKDPRYLSGELEPIAKNHPVFRTENFKAINRGKTVMRNIKTGERKRVNCDEAATMGDDWVHNAKDRFAAKNKNGDIEFIYKNDPRFLSGELTSLNKGKLPVIDKNGNRLQITKEEYYNNRNQYTIFSKNKIAVKDKNGNTFNVSKDDPRYLSGELVGVTKGKIVVKDKDGNIFNIDKNDPRYLSGEYTSIQSGRIYVADENNNHYYVYKNDSRLKTGELKEVSKHHIKTKKVRIYNITTHEIKAIEKEKNIPDGWTKANIVVAYNPDIDKWYHIDKRDPRIKEQKLILTSPIIVRDNTYNIFQTYLHNPKLKTGELHPKYEYRKVGTKKRKYLFEDDPLVLSGEYKLITNKENINKLSVINPNLIN